MRILVTGSTGLLGQALMKRLAASCEVIGLSRHAVQSAGTGTHVICDLTDPEATRRVVWRIRPDVIVHTQALADVDRCEAEPALAHAQNVQTTAHVVGALAAWPSCGLLFVSTSYVFEGTQTDPYEEADAPHPINVYGSTKLAAERLVLSHARSLVVRTGLLFGPGRMNFCDHVVTQLKTKAPVEAFVDQVTSPTYTDDLAVGIQALITNMAASEQPGGPRLFHVVNTGWCTRLAFAHYVATLIGGDPKLIHGVPMAVQRRPAPRPRYAALTSTRLTQVVGRQFPSWQHALQVYLRERHWLN